MSNLTFVVSVASGKVRGIEDQGLGATPYVDTTISVYLFQGSSNPQSLTGPSLPQQFSNLQCRSIETIYPEMEPCLQ
jgi:hypothetical protein